MRTPITFEPAKGTDAESLTGAALTWDNAKLCTFCAEEFKTTSQLGSAREDLIKDF